MSSRKKFVVYLYPYPNHSYGRIIKDKNPLQAKKHIWITQNLENNPIYKNLDDFLKNTWVIKYKYY